MASASPTVERIAGQSNARSGDSFESFEDDGTKTPTRRDSPVGATWRKSPAGHGSGPPAVIDEYL